MGKYNDMTQVHHPSLPYDGILVSLVRLVSQLNKKPALLLWKWECLTWRGDLPRNRVVRSLLSFWLCKADVASAKVVAELRYASARSRSLQCYGIMLASTIFLGSGILKIILATAKIKIYRFAGLDHAN